MQKNTFPEGSGEGGGGAATTDGSTIPSELERIATLYPDRKAIGSGSWQPTFAQLHNRTGSLASLLQMQCERKRPIAIVGTLDGPLIGSIVGVMKAGNIAAVLNPTEPVVRLRAALEQLTPALLVSDLASFTIAEQAARGLTNVVVFEDVPETNGFADTGVVAGDLAALIRTSASTGPAKWVMQTHRNLVHLADQHNSVMRLGPDERILLLASPSGSQALATIFTALFHGAAVCPFSVAEVGISRLSAWLRKQQITVYVSAASAFRSFVKCLTPDECFDCIKVVKLGAESITAADVFSAVRLFPNREIVYCSYSSAETGNIAQFVLDGRTSLQSGFVPLGSPSKDVELLLLDDSGNAVRDNKTGEIVVRGSFLSPGYWCDEARTNERFGLASDSGARCYRTGDLGRRDRNGELHFSGRGDRAVKIRGTLVDVDDVERALQNLVGVQASAVCVRTAPDGSSSLSAFVVATESGSRGNLELRTELGLSLAEPMIPSTFAFLDQLPLTPHGKIDREKLLQEIQPGSLPNVLPGLSTASEFRLGQIWEQVFIGATANSESHIFDFGGDSLTLAVLAAKIQESFGVELCMQDFLADPTLSRLAQRIEHKVAEISKNDASVPALEIAKPECAGALSFAQEAIWSNCQRSEDARANYRIARRYELHGHLNVPRLREAMNEMYQRHDILHTVFRASEGNVQTVIVARPDDALPLVDLSSAQDARSAAITFFDEEARRPMDLADGPLVRFILLRLSSNEHWLVRVSHHIVADGWSWVLFFGELGRLYQQKLKGSRNGEGVRISTEAPQYRDYAAWERRVFAKGSEARAEIARWWKDTLSKHLKPLSLPFRKSSLFSQRAVAGDGIFRRRLDAGARQRFTKFARHETATHSAIGIAILSAQLAAAMDCRAIMIGVHVVNRKSAASQNILGDYANLAPLCLEVDNSVTFREWTRIVQQKIAAMQAHAELPREEIWAELGSQGIAVPEIQVIFSGSAPKFPSRLGDLRLVRPPDSRITMPWGLTFKLDFDEPDHECEVTFDARLHHPAKVRKFVHRYLQLFDVFLQNPERSLRELL